MKVLLQRVSQASVMVEGTCVGAIGHGLLVLVGLEQNDTAVQWEGLAKRLLTYRVFADAEGKMNRSVEEVDGGVLLVSQFTLAANCSKGRRPSFTSAMPPALAEAAFNAFVAAVRQASPTTQVATGQFGTTMQVALVNEGPVTFLLEA